MASNLPFGTKSNCRFCGQPMVWEEYTPPGELSWRLRRQWAHVRPRIEGKHTIACLEEDLPPNDDGNKLPSTWMPSGKPVDWCCESTQTEGICNRPVKYEPRYLCGIHSKRWLEVDKKKEEQNRRDELDQHIVAALTPFIEELKEFWDIDAHLEKTPGRMTYASAEQEYTGYLCVNPGKLKEILEDKTEEF